MRPQVCQAWINPSRDSRYDRIEETIIPMAKSLKIISWNVNGIRSVLRKGTFLAMIRQEDPDMLCLQETKAQQGQAEIDLPQYEEFWNSAKKAGYAGTAIFTKQKPISVTFDLPGAKSGSLLDRYGDTLTEGRVITAEFKNFFLVNVYTPNAKPDLSRKLFRHDKWDRAFLAYLTKLEKIRPVIMCGDLNVAHNEIDLARPKENKNNAGFTAEERKGADNLVASGLVDTFRHFYPDQVGAYTWWSHFGKARERNVGWRIDYFFANKSIMKKIKSAFILPEVMGSDHAPVGIILET